MRFTVLELVQFQIMSLGVDVGRGGEWKYNKTLLGEDRDGEDVVALEDGDGWVEGPSLVCKGREVPVAMCKPQRVWGCWKTRMQWGGCPSHPGGPPQATPATSKQQMPTFIWRWSPLAWLC